MIDLHSHALPLIDDGSISFEQSLDMINDARIQGVTDMVLTPHLNKRYNLSVNQVKTAFEQFVNDERIVKTGVNLYLGQEIYVGRSFNKVLSDGEFLTMNGTDLVLLEFDYTDDFDIVETVYQLKRKGYRSIIAHFERYSYAGVSLAKEVKNLGGFIQVNSDSCVNGLGLFGTKKVKDLFNENLVDFVASDVHSFRQSKLKKAKEIVEKKYGKIVGQAVFDENALEIIKG